ncbi:MAG TPA: DJ-1/PfpI family protein [Flavipsychrobacter sp.]|nr:DJ-1/PfpI family protein [Flavipsychrobacter sp.]
MESATMIYRESLRDFCPELTDHELSISGKLIGAICHAPVVLASADILKGRKLTGYWNIQVDLKNAGSIVVEQPVVTDGNLITSRHPIDVADFSRAVANWFNKQ